MTIAVRGLPVPGRSIWWLGGAMLGGLAWPSVIAALLALAAYYPVGTALSGTLIDVVGSSFGSLLATVALTAVLMLAGLIHSLLARSWRPLVLSLLFGFCACVGLLPGLYAGAGLKSWAFDLFSSRSMAVVDAIEEYVRINGHPPASLADLVPAQLRAVPITGMAAYPHYRYEPSSGDCSANNAWHLQVDVQEFIDMNRLLYCPAQDYEQKPGFVQARARIGAWAHDRIDF